MKVAIDGNRCIVTREPGDPKFRNGGGWDPNRPGDVGESKLLHHVKKALIAQGYDVIKKRMAKDGHLVDDHQQYIRTRKPTKDPKKNIYVYNNYWAIQGAEKDFNENGETVLSFVDDVFPIDGVPREL
jgi:hypothetical protein